MLTMDTTVTIAYDNHGNYGNYGNYSNYGNHGNYCRTFTAYSLNSTYDVI